MNRMLKKKKKKKKGDEIYWIEVAARHSRFCVKRGGSGKSLGHVCLYLNTERQR